MIPEYSANHLRFVKLLVATYLLTHFIYLIPFAAELFSGDGMFPAKLSLTYGYFPNVLNLFDTAATASAFLVFLSSLTLLMLLGLERKWLFLVLWFGWACLLNRNPLIRNPGYPYVGWILLSFAVLFPLKRPSEFKMPKLIFYTAWALLASGYTLSGLDKLSSPSWQNGEAISLLLKNPLSRDNWFVHLMLSWTWLHAPLTYLSLFFEIAFLPFALLRRTRPWIWLALILMHLSILLIVDFADLTFGMLMIHLFTFDPRWIKPRNIKSKPVIFFDGVCGLCNKAVDFVIEEDFTRIFRYAPLQGNEAKRLLDKTRLQKLDTMYLFQEGKLYDKSCAWILIMQNLGGIWALALVFKLLPKPLRDLFYQIIARYRYQLFGQRDSCRIPTARERSLFLD